jgi:DNA-binding MarR family transcriptional regulator
VKTEATLACWEAVLRLHGQIAPRLDNILSARHALGLTDFLALRAIARNWEPHIRIQHLAAELGISHSAVSRLVGKLEKAQLLARYDCVTDRRGTFTELTDRGREVLAEAEVTYQSTVAEMMASHAAAQALSGALTAD